MIDNDMHESDSLIGISSKNTRLGFIRKVYLIVLFLITIVAGFVIMACYWEAYRDFLVNNPWVAIVAFVVQIWTGYGIVCYKSIAREVPKNYIYLTFYATSIAVIVSFVGLIHTRAEIATAAGLTFLLVGSLTIYALTTKTDFTFCGAFLFSFLCLTIVCGVGLAFWPKRIVSIGLSWVTLVLFSVYLIMDTQLIVGGKEYQYSSDDYIVAALQLFIDIVKIFLEILKIFAQASR
jgi:hypothetical protein